MTVTVGAGLGEAEDPGAAGALGECDALTDVPGAELADGVDVPPPPLPPPPPPWFTSSTADTPAPATAATSAATTSVVRADRFGARSDPAAGRGTGRRGRVRGLLDG